MELEVNGIQYARFTTASAVISLDTIARGFSFTAVSTEGLPLPFKGGEPCRVIVDGTPVLDGFIEVVNVNYDASGHTITVEGRSKTGDLVDSSLIGTEINPPISLKKIIEDVISEIGLDIDVIDNTNIEIFNKAEDKVGPAVGENAFQFIERLARKRQVLLTSDGDGNVVITRSEPTEINVNLQNIIQSDRNNIISGSVSYDRTQRFRDYLVKSQLNTSSLVFSGSTDLSDVVDQGGSALDNEVRSGRQLVMKAEKASSSPQATERAIWEANIRRTRSQLYSVVVNEYRTKAGELWSENKLVFITDEFADINARMLINSIEFKFSTQEGRQTALGFVDKDAYQVEISEPQPVDKVGGNLFGSAG